MERLFGTDGIRGVANVDPMTPEMALQIGRAAAHVCGSGGNRRRIVVGNDTRRSGAMLESALCAGVCSMGVDVWLAGPMTTPGIAWITRSLGTDAGIMISASHNPFPDNGIKIFSRDGCKLPDAEEDEIERLIASKDLPAIRPTGDAIGEIKRVQDAAERYGAFCRNAFPQDRTLEGMKIILDCANGATSHIAPKVFSGLGADLRVIHCEPDGTNINDRCGSQDTADLAAAVRRSGADIGLAFDGDGDRLIAVDEKGGELTGDHILAICGKMYKEQGWLANNLVVSTVMSNYGFLLALERLGIDHAQTAVGDRHVLEMMKSKGAVIGGEPSGHLIFLKQHTTGDGILSALQLLAAISLSGAPLSRLSEIVQLMPQRTVNVAVTRKPPLDSIAELQKAIREAERELGGKGRLLVRYSGTQSLCRVMVEGPTKEMTDRLARRLADAVQKSIG
jgi:phosphoglucosamine mutase